MKTPRIVPIYVLCLLFFASCSQQRYGSRSYVKVNKKSEKREPAKAKKSAEKSLEEFATVEKEAVTTTTTTLPAEKVQKETVLVKENPIPSKKEQKASRRIEKRMKKVMEKLPEALAMQIPLLQKKQQTLNPNDNTEDFHVSEHWLKIMIVGLVLLLVGILLPHPVGTIFYIVGSVLLVVGLIFLLLDLVD